MTGETGHLLSLSGLSKAFPGVQALKNVSFGVRRGEVHALIGENGAGKSTLMHILCGVLRPDSGEIILNGNTAHFKSPDEAIRSGIGMVFQELSLVDELNVALNIFPNRQPLRGKFFIDWRMLFLKAEQLLAWCGFDLDGNKRVSRLTKAERQLTEIVKAISTDPLLLIMDEPTSSLGAKNAELLFRLIKKLKDAGKSVIYISHNLDEIFEIADRVTVLRDGEYIDTVDVHETTEQHLVALMAGRELAAASGREKVGRERACPCLEVNKLTVEPWFRNISCSFGKGEIIGLAGLVGAGRTEFARTVFGLYKPEKGEIFLEGGRLSIMSPRAAIKNGIAYVSDDRKYDGLFLRKTLSENLIANKLSRYSVSAGMISGTAVTRDILKIIGAGNIICRGPEEKAFKLSGGNQQKLLLAAWLSMNPKVIMIDEPTRGVDVRSKGQIYDSIFGLASKGASVVIISSDIKEILHVCDRVLVFHKGNLVGDYPAAGVSRETILACASGISTN